MGPRAAGLSRSKGGAIWSPWPWPLSAQAGPYLSLTLILVPIRGTRPTLCVQPTSPSQPAALFLRLTAQERGKAAWGLSTTTTWLLGGLIS